MSLNKYTYLKKILRSVLKEEAEQNSIIDAITKKNKVIIAYNDGLNGSRKILPVAYGKTSSGNLAVRAYQEGGVSNSNNVGWKLFRTDEILNWDTIKDEHFSKPPKDYNDNGDESMPEVYVTSDFSNADNRQETSTTDNIATYDTSQNTNIAGIDKTTGTNDNTSSINDMSYTSRATTDVNSTQTVGPVTKDNLEDNIENSQTTKPDYANAYDNGPLTKDRYKEMASGNETDSIDSMNFADDAEVDMPVDEFKDDNDEEYKNLEYEQ